MNEGVKPVKGEQSAGSVRIALQVPLPLPRQLRLIGAGPLEAVGTMHSGAPDLLDEVRSRLSAAYPELDLANATISGGLTAVGAASVRLCGSTVGGTTAIANTTGFTLVGDTTDDACGGNARCTTCRVEFVAGEPDRMTEAEKTVLADGTAVGGERLDELTIRQTAAQLPSIDGRCGRRAELRGDAAAVQQLAHHELRAAVDFIRETLPSPLSQRKAGRRNGSADRAHSFAIIPWLAAPAARTYLFGTRDERKNDHAFSRPS